tara:strand:+ start:4427 stop:4648 length:222 start_codon:yes stop_codon:yes gene_type:complete
MTKKVKQEATVTSNTDELNHQLNYAQKVINILQTKVNELNGRAVQLEAQLIIATEAKENMLKQVDEVEKISQL